PAPNEYRLSARAKRSAKLPLCAMGDQHALFQNGSRLATESPERKGRCADSANPPADWDQGGRRNAVIGHGEAERGPEQRTDHATFVGRVQKAVRAGAS